MSISYSDATADAVADQFSFIPQSMKDQPRWVCWRYESRDGEQTKVPICASDFTNAKSNDATTWTTFQKAVEAFRASEPPYCCGVGFMLGDGWAGVDLDNCLDHDLNQKTWAKPILDRFAATYMEISPSGNGIKIIVRGMKPGPKVVKNIKPKTKDNKAEKIEMYSPDGSERDGYKGRMFTLTGRRYGTATEVAEMQAELDLFYSEQFGDDAAEVAEAVEAEIDFDAATAEAWQQAAPASTATDNEIIARIKSRDREGNIWQGNISAYGSNSEARYCLLGYVCSQTADDTQVDRIMCQWGALELEKWNRLGRSEIKKIRSEPRMATKLTPSYPDTDMGNAEHFVALHGDNLRYVVEWKSWIVWDKRRWKIDIGGKKVEQLAMRFIRYDLFEHANRVGDNEKRAKAHKWAMSSQQGKRLNVMLERASALLAIDADQLDRNAWLFNCRNGTIELRSGTLKPHDRSDMITKISQIDFDAAATCPTWEMFIAKTLPTDLAAYVQKAVGYSMTGDCSEKACFMQIGPSNTGKSTFSDTVKLLMGDYGLTAQQSVVLQTIANNKTNSEDEANLFGARFVSVSEPGEYQKWDEAKLKRMVPSNGSRIRGRLLYQNSFEFEATHKIWLDANHRPTVRGGTDDAVWNRIKLISFDHIVPIGERDGSLPSKFKTEASGILNWMVVGLKAWLSEGLVKHEPQAVCAAVNDYREESDVLGQFLRDCIQPNDAAKVEKGRLYTCYEGWCNSNGVEYVLNSKVLGKQLAERGYKQDKRRWYFLGMDLSNCATDIRAEEAVEEIGKSEKEERPF